ncbi:phosphotransferase family protein [Streptomyces sp. NBC_00841]|uniref:phosphotransferase family protein n=1 Tax=Streptomyces sp. NBC_00841 TaxID=2975847 RepID=UPI002DDBD053|nr:phosphotransferase family protein [Streptomyces sp. NBC_00841]WRZ97008.1 phosphotransferase family protein [Streptomyces sp. NBC_00841]
MAADAHADAGSVSAGLVGVDLDRLTPYLEAALGLAGRLRASLIAGGRSNLTYRLTDGRGDWVLRRPPVGHVLPTAHDMAREYRVIDALHGTGVPVPGPVVLCQDPDILGADFYVMERVEGPVLRGADDTRDLAPDVAARCARHLVDVLVSLHTTDPAVLEGFGRPEGFVARQVSRWARQWSLSATRELPGIDELVRRLELAVPQAQRVSVVHGDYRLDNVIFAPGEQGEPAGIAAVIDWEMSTLGDPLTDLGLMLVYWDEITENVTGTRHAVSANPGFPGRRELADAYARASGLDLSALDFYVAFGYFKLAVIAEGIHSRFLAGQTVGEGFEKAGTAVPALVDSGLATLRSSEWS